LVTVNPKVRGVARTHKAFDFRLAEMKKKTNVMTAAPIGNVSRTDHQKTKAPEQMKTAEPRKDEKVDNLQERRILNKAPVVTAPEKARRNRQKFRVPIPTNENSKATGLIMTENRGWV
tara:strand:+ start:133 stop:486 length:354 start_codon:yes stop_codon:yes gene_type:complete